MNISFIGRFRVFVVAILMAGIRFGSVDSLALGQDAPADEVVFDRLYPVAIHPGTCTEDIEAPAFDLGLTDLVGSDEDAELGVVGGPDVLSIDTTITTTFDELFSDNHAVVVHHPDEFGTVIACGDFGGYIEGGKSAVTLVAVNDSGINGVAILDEDEGEFFGLLDDEVKVTVYLIKMKSIERDESR